MKFEARVKEYPAKLMADFSYRSECLAVVGHEEGTYQASIHISSSLHEPMKIEQLDDQRHVLQWRLAILQFP